MRFLDLTLPTPAENLALDEALLLSVDTAPCRTSDSTAVETQGHGALLRVWSTDQPMVVIGRSSRIAQEVHLEQARARGVPVLRRCSGGAAVALGPGCLVYSLIIHLESACGLRMLDVAHRYVMDRMLRAIGPFTSNAAFDGTCDLVIEGKKFSGNSLRVGRNWMLYHGTLLLNMDLCLINDLLRHPPKEPGYRSGRPHAEFVTNLNIDTARMVDSIRQAWQAWQPTPDLPLDQVRSLVEKRYSADAWNLLR